MQKVAVVAATFFVYSCIFCTIKPVGAIDSIFAHQQTKKL